MKYKFLSLLSVLAVSNVNAQDLIIDSGWISNVPSLRSANVFGNNITMAFDIYRPQNEYYKFGSYAIETLISMKYHDGVHELGHANVAKYYKNRIIFCEKTVNWWVNSVNPNTHSYVQKYGDINEIEFNIAGFNAVTNLAEQNYNNKNFIFDTFGRLSSIYYILCGPKNNTSDFRKLEEFGYKISKKQFVASQLITYGLSFGKIQFYSYLNRDGLSIRARNYNYRNFDIALESIFIGNRYNLELSANKTFNFRNIKIKPEMTTSLRGVGYNLELAYKRFVIGYRNPNVNTLSGARELNREFYAQFKL